MPQGFDPAVARDFGIALLLGALIGVEREKRNAREGFGIAGLRSFVLFAQIGAVGGWFARTQNAPWVLAAAIVAGAAAILAGYVTAARAHPERIGITTELAAIMTLLLGALATTGNPEVATGLGVATAALLAYKQPLHNAVGRLVWDDVLVGLRFLSAAFIVLPLLPDRAIDPWNALNLYKLWLLVLLISGMSLVGYVATRWLGGGHGIAITAATGGLVSSTAVTLALVKQSREPGQSPRQLGGGILLAWGVMFARVLVAASVVNAALFQELAAPFLVMAAVCGLVAASFLWRNPEKMPVDKVPLKNPFSLLAAGKFALLFAAVQLLIGIGREHWPGNGTFVVAFLAGLTDVDAITLAMAEHGKAGAEAMRTAVIAIVIACAANTLVKGGFAVLSGRDLLRPIGLGTAAILLAGAAGLWWS